jgi:DNA-binding IclR family transcriptional regulator
MAQMKSLNKVLDILEVFLDIGDSEIRLSELAQFSKLNKATVYHITSVLVARGYLSQVGRRGKYVLGPKFLNFSAIIKRKDRIKNVAMTHMIRLNQLVGEPVSLSTWDGDKAIFVDEVHSKYSFPLRVVPDPGAIIPLYCTAVGKVFLAGKTERELEDYFNSNNIKAHTPNTITDLSLLKDHLTLVAKDGVAYDDEELYLGVRTMAAGIRDAEEKIVACISIMGPTVRLTREKLRKMAPDVKHCAMAISQDLGYIDK